MIKIICTCSHLENKHRLRDQSAKEILDMMVRTGHVKAQHLPDRLSIDEYFFGEAFCSKEEVIQKIEDTRNKFSSCQSFTCKCMNFQADNLKSLENHYEREANKIIY